MVNLRERTELVNGVLNIQSAIGKGTQIQVFIPLSEEAADQLNNARDGQENQPAR
jgi:chemotaxis protein histidine kinase CheA